MRSNTLVGVLGSVVVAAIALACWWTSTLKLEPKSVIQRHGGLLRASGELLLHGGTDRELLKAIVDASESTPISSIDFRWSGVSDANLQSISKVRGLRSIDLSETHISGSGIQFLRDTFIENVTLGGLPPKRATSSRSYGLIEDNLRCLSEMSSLRSVAVNYSTIGESDLSWLPGCRNLESLMLWHCRMSQVAMQSIATTYSLRELHLFDSSIPDGIGQACEKLPSLRTVSLGGSAISHAELLRVIQVESIVELDLSSRSISRNLVAAISERRGLKALYLSHTAIDDTQVRTLSKCPDLEILACDYTKITDRSLDYLGDMKSLRALHVEGCESITMTALEKWRDAHPEVVVFPQ